MLECLVTAEYRRSLERSNSSSTQAFRGSNSGPTLEVSSGPGPDTKAPEPFSGDKAHELRHFVQSCKVNFLCYPHHFTSERRKVLYAASFLTGIASDWFDPYLDDSGPSNVLLDSWTNFEDALRTMFGDSNIQATAEYRLDALKMNDRDKISTYITQFRTSAKETGWSDSALRFAFKKGLASRILDELAHMDIDSTLESLIVASKKVDDRHWERERERKLFHPSNLSSKVKKEGSKTDRPSPEPSSMVEETTEDVEHLLTEEGKLQETEKERRKKLGLCNYCAGPHKLQDCPVRPPSNLRGVRTSLRGSKSITTASNSAATSENE